MFRLSIVDILAIHFFIGVGFAGFNAIRCYGKERPRTWFRFDHGWDSFWRWYAVAYLFEVATSFLMGKSLYVELALSLFQAFALTGGLYVVDRGIGLFRNAGEADDKP